MVDTEIKGNSTKLLVQYSFTMRNIIVSKPIAQACAYDLVADINGKLYRIQVKYCQKSKIGITFSTKSIRTKKGKPFAYKYTTNDADYICTVYQNTTYMIPIATIENRNSVTLAFSNDWKNGHHIMYASDYELDVQLNRIRNNMPLSTAAPHIIQQFSLSGEYIGEDNSLAECPPCIEDPRRVSHISACINGHRKSAFGYIWKKKP